MEDLEEDEDVIIEGSELHQSLVKMGYTNFEVVAINRNDLSSKESFTSKYKWFERFRHFFKNWHPYNDFFGYAPKISYISSKQFKTILEAESLLDDHAELVQNFAEKNSYTLWDECFERSSLLVFITSLGIGYSFFKKKKILALLATTSVAAFTVCRRYNEFRAIGALKDLVAVQNELYHLYKKSLGILRNVYRLRIDRKKFQTKFSNLEIDHLKYLQPITENLVTSIEKVSRTYYQASSMIVGLLPKKTLENDTLTIFEADEFAIIGEITYENLKRLFYVYILVQSDILQLLAIAYNTDTWLNNRQISYSSLTRIIAKLCATLTKENNHLSRILDEYENCKGQKIKRKFRIPSVSKWRDLYLNLDLIARKLRNVYDDIVSTMEEIEKREDDETTEDTFVAELATKIPVIYSEIEKSRNYAEFNDLLMAILQRSRKFVDNQISVIDPLSTKSEEDRTIVKDTEPRIIDEVFEEYINEEYFKPLYDNNDDNVETALEIAKFDELLVNNFMSELKEALVEKYKSMSEREAKALLRKYRGTKELPNFEENETTKVVKTMNSEKSIVPHPPPLPEIDVTTRQSRTIFPENEKTRALSFSSNLGNFDKNQQRSVASPSLAIEDFDTKRFSIDLPKLGTRLPAFVTFTEEFIGSGENSDEELEKIDNDSIES